MVFDISVALVRGKALWLQESGAKGRIDQSWWTPRVGGLWERPGPYQKVIWDADCPIRWRPSAGHRTLRPC